MVALVPSVARITASVIAAAPHLKAIVQFGAGLDNVDREAAAARGIAVRNVPGANAQAVAELALFLMLALARRLPRHAQSFANRVVGDPPGTELQGKTLGIVGLGASGRALARMARGIGMEVIAVRRNPVSDPDASWVGGPGDLHAMLGPAGLREPAHPDLGGDARASSTRPRSRAMKPTAYLVNVGPRRPHRPRGAGGGPRREAIARRRPRRLLGRSRPIPPTRCCRGTTSWPRPTSAASPSEALDAHRDPRRRDPQGAGGLTAYCAPSSRAKRTV